MERPPERAAFFGLGFAELAPYESLRDRLTPWGKSRAS